MATKIQIRRDTKANWANVNPTLAEGEPGHETDTYMRKVGDGKTPWNDLPYLGNPTLQMRGDSTTETMSQLAITRELESVEKLVGDILIDYGNALSKYGGSPAIDYGNASTVAIEDY